MGRQLVFVSEALLKGRPRAPRCARLIIDSKFGRSIVTRTLPTIDRSAASLSGRN